MASGASPACRTARDQIFLRRHVEKKPDESTTTFFPLDRLRKYLSKKQVKEILECSCMTCQDDCKAIGNHIKPVSSLPLIVGEDGDPEDTRKTAFSLFSLLIHIGHPILIIGFLDQDRNDYSLELYPETFKESDLESYTQNFATVDNVGFKRFAFQFATYMPQFAVRHMDSVKFSRYPTGTILPFIKEEEIGIKETQDGQWTNEGAHGRVFSFEIYGEYNKFPHARDVKKFARKTVFDTTKVVEHLERVNLQNVRRFNDKHIVRLIKAYSLGREMNLVFPLADTNLDHLLRDPHYGYASARGSQLESCGAWKQLLGIAKALAKIAGVPNDVAPTGPSRGWGEYGFHFDLKPANILISEDGTWLITDFGQATFTESNDRTPRVSNQGGTDAYAPPEIDNLDEQFSRRYDVWSLGCIILEVTAFLVLGYDGLKGSKGLDQVRHSSDGWSRRAVDDRFFHREERQAEPVVKPAIKSFMLDLKKHMQHADRHSQQFLADILGLIEDMLQPAVERRRDISEVIRILEGAITQASSLDDVGQPLQIGAAPGELPIGAPELGLVNIWHWNRSFQGWQPSSLRLFEDLNGNMRFYSLAYNRTPHEITLRRHRDEILPNYAYWYNERPQTNEAWLTFADVDPAGVSVVPGLIYAFDHLKDARCVQSKLTYQTIEISLPLKSLRVKKYVKIGRKALNAVVGVFVKDAEDGKIQATLDEGDDLGPATIQLWTEQVNEIAVKRREKQSVSSEGLGSKRKPRTQPHQQPGYRDICPRRAVIYLHRHGCILTVKTDVRWISRVVNDDIIHFQPCKPDLNPHFEASFIQPTHGSVAGLPLCPQILRSIESQNCFEADQFVLQFAVGGAARQFNNQYRQMKMKWEKEKEEIEKLQGFTPLQILPEPYPDPLPTVSKGKEKARQFSTQDYYASDAGAIAKGKGRATEPDTPQDHTGNHNGYRMAQPQDPQTSPAPKALLSPHKRTPSEEKVKQSRNYGHRSGGRGVPPKSWRMTPN